MLDQIAWRPEIGDPTFYGWVTVAAYAAAAILCWFASARGPARERRLWLLASLVMAFLCANKQLDLQTLFTDIGRAIAKHQGWYEERRKYQAVFIVAVVAAGGIAALVMLRLFRSSPGPVKGMLLGLAALGTFIVVRAASFEKMDSFIKSNIAGVKANHVMELGGIAIVGLSALWSMWSRRKRR